MAKAKPVRVIICGSRDWCWSDPLYDKIFRRLPHGSLVITGGARGADTRAQADAEYYGFETVTFLADWEKYGKAAGGIRNKTMILDGEPDFVVAFIQDMRDSPGTKNMLLQAMRYNVPVFAYRYATDWSFPALTQAEIEEWVYNG